MSMKYRPRATRRYSRSAVPIPPSLRTTRETSRFGHLALREERFDTRIEVEGGGVEVVFEAMPMTD